MSTPPRPSRADVPHRTPTWLALQPDPVLAFLHLPQRGSARSTAVLILPPFGWEEMCSYRGRRAWAQALARAGFPAARIDFPGAGDSGGSPGDPGRLEAWTGAVSGAAAWLRDATGAGRVAVIGIGLGGMVACLAAARDAPIDDLILWGVPARGSRMLRELRAHGRIVAAPYAADLDAQPRPSDGALGAIGFLLSGKSARAIGALVLTALPLPRAGRRRVLLLGRDRLGADERLKEHFERRGAQVSVVDTTDYNALMAHPQEARVPRSTIERTVAWLGEGLGGPPAAIGGSPPAAIGGFVAPRAAIGGSVAPRARHSIDLAYAGSRIRETPIELEIGAGRLFGVLSAPGGRDGIPVCGVLLGAGALRHTGPNRAWVELARRWAARGVPTVRIDLEGIGESDGDASALIANAGFYAPEMTEQALSVLEQLPAHGLPNRFVLAGLCSGAYWALHAALADPRVAGALMVNLYAFYWSEALVAERDTDVALAALRHGMLRRIAGRGVKAEHLRKGMRSLRRGRLRTGGRRSVEAAQACRVEAALDQLADQGTEALLLLSDGEPLYEQLARQGQIDQIARSERWPNLSVERIPSRDHMFRASWLQREVHDSLDRALERVLARAHPPRLEAGEPQELTAASEVRPRLAGDRA